MKEPNNSPIGVCVWPEPGSNAPRTVSYPNYVHEILAHAGLCYSAVAPDQLQDRLPALRALVTLGEYDPGDALKRSLEDWVRRGGAWISVAGVCGLPEVFGADVEPQEYAGFNATVNTLGEGYLKPSAEHPALAHITIPLHYFNGLPVSATNGRPLAVALDAHQRDTRRPALVENRLGKGRAMLIAPDLTGAVVRIQQGVAVTRDGVPAPDGTAPINDGVLKSDDGAVLDWSFDRFAVPGVPGLKAFLEPIADQLRELLMRTIFHMCAEQGVSVPLLWLYPRDLPALAVMSHDSDGNNVECAHKLLDVLAQAGINSTWAVICPGYSPELVDKIRAAGHELGMHFDAYSDGTEFAEAEFARQHKRLVELFGDRPVTNKNHFLRWEGDTEFFRWCAQYGIELDQSKGPSKTGCAGFNFGTCHPHFPVEPDGSPIDVLELPTITMDLVRFAPTELAKPFVDAACRAHGVLHLLFHPAHMARERVAEALLYGVRIAKEKGMEWWTVRRLNDWERARRTAVWTAFGPDGATLSPGADLREASILWLGVGDPIKVDGRELDTSVVTRWGFAFRSVALDAFAGVRYTVST